MAFIERLLLREDIDALEHDLARAQAEDADANTLDLMERDIARLKMRFAALRPALEYPKAA